MIPQIPAVLSSVPMVLMIVAVQVLVAFGRVSSHLSRSPEIGLISYFLQYLLHRLSEYGIHSLRVTLPSLSRKISPRLTRVVPFRPEVICFGVDNLLLSPPLQLIFLHSFVLVYPIPQLINVGDRFSSEGFS